MSLKFLKVGTTTPFAEESAITTSSGAGDASKIVGTDSNGKIDSTFMPTGFGSDTSTITAGEALSAGNLIYLNSAGNALKADASAQAKEAIGFVLSAISNGASGTVYFGSGFITGLTSLTPGTRYFLDTTAGGITSTPPTGSGKIVQQVGFARTSTVLYFEPQPAILLV